jgi:hypothetical protein
MSSRKENPISISDGPFNIHGAIVVTAHRVATGDMCGALVNMLIGAPSTTLGAGLQRWGAPLV